MTHVRFDRIAEAEVANLCRAIGGTVTQVDEDENGWDLMVEFPPRTVTAFRDTDPPLRRCLIQVKATRGRNLSAKVKLSNALKFALEPLPCFVVLLTYPTGRTTFEAAYVRHVWTDIMGASLKAARAAAVDGQPLHHKHLSLAFKPADQRNGSLAEAIISSIDEIGPGYGEKKGRIADSIGYERGSGAAEVILAEGIEYRDLEDLLLGLRTEIPIADFITSDRRFDLPGPRQSKGGGRLSVDVRPVAKCVVTLRNNRTGDELSWTGGLFSGANLDAIPRTERRLRVVAGSMDLLISGDGSVKATWSSPNEERRQLHELVSASVFRSWMDGSDLEMLLWSELGPLPSFRTTFEDLNETDHWSEVLAALRALSTVIPIERRPSDLKLSMNEVLEKLKLFTQLHSLLSPDRIPVRLEGSEEWAISLDAASHVVFPWAGLVGDYVIVAVIERDITGLHRSGSRIDLTTANGRLLRGTAMLASAASDKLVAGEVHWAKERARLSHKQIISYHPAGEGIGDLVLTWEDDDPRSPLLSPAQAGSS